MTDAADATRLQATPAALALVEELRARHGALQFLLSHGCCDGTTPMCLTLAEYQPGPDDQEIHVDSHAQQGDVRLFFFHYNCWVNGELRMSVRSGQAGFFTTEELANSAGVLWAPEAAEPKKDARLDPPAAELWAALGAPPQPSPSRSSYQTVSGLTFASLSSQSSALDTEPVGFSHCFTVTPGSPYPSPSKSVPAVMVHPKRAKFVPPVSVQSGSLPGPSRPQRNTYARPRPPVT